MEKEKLSEILKNHEHWLREDCEGWENMRADLTRAKLYRADLTGADLTGANLYRANLTRADLTRANLTGADLTRADLTRANLTGANLTRADLTRANLTGADLTGANLYGADLTRADLYGADLTGADLTRAKLTGANLNRADLTGADLYGADLYGADLYGADLTRADLTRANLTGANLTGANLTGAKNIPFVPYACPDFGIFIGFKKANGKIVVLEIPEDAKRLSSTGRKCRCDKAKVLEIQNLDGTKADISEVSSDRDCNFVYKVGEIVSVPDFDENRWNECSTGIHFFINRQEAVNY